MSHKVGGCSDRRAVYGGTGGAVSALVVAHRIRNVLMPFLVLLSAVEKSRGARRRFWIARSSVMHFRSGAERDSIQPPPGYTTLVCD